jgi:hypothetical protein
MYTILLYKQKIAAETVTEAESVILYAARTLHRRPARSLLSWLSYDSHTLSRQSEKQHKKVLDVLIKPIKMYRNQYPILKSLSD